MPWVASGLASACCSSTIAASASSASVEGGVDAVAGHLHDRASVTLDRAARQRVVRGERATSALGSCSHRRVLPSMSVNRNVTAPAVRGPSARCGSAIEELVALGRQFMSGSLKYFVPDTVIVAESPVFVSWYR